MARLVTTYWRDIPAQVIASNGREKAKVLLSNRFAVAIDKAAMRADMAGSRAYLDEW
ncbi:MAG: virulence factor [Enterobacterales bacterium]|nr:virulence factor [Enterobacterales bacterium]